MPKPDPKEIADAKWMDLSEFLGSPYYQTGLYGEMLKSAAATATVSQKAGRGVVEGLKSVKLPSLGGKMESLYFATASSKL